MDLSFKDETYLSLREKTYASRVRVGDPGLLACRVMFTLELQNKAIIFKQRKHLIVFFLCRLSHLASF